MSHAILFALLATTALTGCFVGHDPTPIERSPSAGTLTIDWSIGFSKAPVECSRSAVDRIEITLQPGGVFEQYCEAFDTSIALAPGSYSASAVLLDASGGVRTTTLAIDPFRIVAGTALDIPIDFPADSFY